MPLEADARGIERMVRDLAIFAGHGTNTTEALKVVTGKVLEAAIRYTPTARAEYIEERVTHRQLMLYSSYSGGEIGKDARQQPEYVIQGQRNNKAWWVTEDSSGTTSRHSRNHGQAFHIMSGNRRWSDAMWQRYQNEEADRKADYQAALPKKIKAGVESRGLSAKSWTDIAESLGISLKLGGKQFIVDAKASNGRTYINGRGTPNYDNPEGAYIDLENWMPILIKNGGAQILQRAIDARRSAFAKELETGVFEDMAQIARRYPFLTINRS